MELFRCGGQLALGEKAVPVVFEDQNPVPAPRKMVLVGRQWERRLRGELEGVLMPGLHHMVGGP